MTQYQSQQPENTRRNYEPKQKEFIDFCKQRFPHENPPETVTEYKLILFLQTSVIDRPRRPEGRKKRILSDKEETRLGKERVSFDENGEPIEDESEDEVEQLETIIVAGTVESYISAIVKLYDNQKERNVNSHPHPRTDSVRQLLKMVVHGEHKRRQENLEDPAKGTMSDGITTFEQLRQFCEEFMFTPSGRLCATGLRDRCMQLIMHHGLLRQDNAKNLLLCHLFTMNLPYNTSGKDCLGLMAVTSEGKTNRTGRKDLKGMLRNRDVNVCPIGALALYFFERFQLMEEAPHFTIPG